MYALVASVALALPGQAPANAGGAWTPLFNGKDLTGWGDGLDNGSSWEVAGGVIEGRGGGPAKPAVLATEREDFANFKLRVVFGCRKRAGGGLIELRRSSPAEGITSSYAVAAVAGPHRLAAIRPSGNVLKIKDFRYGSHAPPARESEPVKASVNRWHTLEVVASGGTVTTYVNGRKADEFTDKKGVFRSGGITLFVCGDSVMQFKEVSIQELPAE